MKTLICSALANPPSEINRSITRPEFLTAYSEARKRRHTHGIFAGMCYGETTGRGYCWSTPDAVATASLSMRVDQDYVCNGRPQQKLERMREMDREMNREDQE